MIREYENKDKIIHITEQKGKRQNADSRTCPQFSSRWVGEIEERSKTELCSETEEETMSVLQIVHAEQE